MRANPYLFTIGSKDYRAIPLHHTDRALACSKEYPHGVGTHALNILPFETQSWPKGPEIPRWQLTVHARRIGRNSGGGFS